MLSDIYCVYFKASPAIATNHESSLSDVQIDRALDRVIDCFDGPNNTIPQLCERCQLITKTYAKVSKAELSHTTTIQHATTLRSKK
jgi:hypothetical protein